MVPQIRVVVGLTVALVVSLCLNAFMGGVLLTKRPPPSVRPPFEQSLAQNRDGANNPGSLFRRGEGWRARSGMGGRDDESRNTPMRGALRDFAEVVPPDVRGPLMSSMRNQRDQIEAKMQGVMAARRASMAALAAEPFDVDALRSALSAQRAAQSDVQATVHEGLMDAIAQMTPEQRQKLSESAGRLFK